jgi:hypothetical protein
MVGPMIDALATGVLIEWLGILLIIVIDAETM